MLMSDSCLLINKVHKVSKFKQGGAFKIVNLLKWLIGVALGFLVFCEVTNYSIPHGLIYHD